MIKRLVFGFVWYVFCAGVGHAQNMERVLSRINADQLGAVGPCYLNQINEQYGTQLNLGSLQNLLQAMLVEDKNSDSEGFVKYVDLQKQVNFMVNKGMRCRPDPDIPNIDKSLKKFAGETARLCRLKSIYSAEKRRSLLAVLEKTSNITLEKNGLSRARIHRKLKSISAADCTVKPSDPKVVPNSTWRDLPKTSGMVHFARNTIPLSELLIPDQYIIFFDAGFFAAGQRDTADIATVLDVESSAIIELLPAFDAALVAISEDTAVSISNRPSVAGLFQDRAAYFSDSKPANNIGQEYLDSFKPNGTKTYSPLPETSTVRVYIMDGGIRRSHTEIGDKVKHWRAIGDKHGGYYRDLCQNHGTAIAGLVAGKDGGISTKVELIDVDLTPCDVVDPKKFPASHILLGLDWITRAQEFFNDKTPTLINMSFGVPVQYSDSDLNELYAQVGERSFLNFKVFEERFSKFVQRHKRITIITAAGNEGENACHYFPAKSSEVVTVGGLNENGKSWDNSNFGPCIDTLAPAENVAIVSTVKSTKDGERVDGTSFAAALVTGVFANRLAAGQNLDYIKSDILRPYTEDRIEEIETSLGSLPNRPNAEVELKYLAKIHSPFKADCEVSSYDGKLSLRAKSAVSGKLLQTLNNGQTFKVIKRKDKKWMFIELPSGRQGWVARYDKRATLSRKLGQGGPC